MTRRRSQVQVLYGPLNLFLRDPSFRRVALSFAEPVSCGRDPETPRNHLETSEAACGMTSHRRMLGLDLRCKRTPLTNRRARQEQINAISGAIGVSPWYTTALLR